MTRPWLAPSCSLYSPAVALNSSIPSSSIVDLVSSSVAGCLAFLDPRGRPWRIVTCLIALAALAGFRQSGVGMLVPLIVTTLFIHWRQARIQVCAGTVLGLAVFLAWYVPLALSAGGWCALTELTSTQFHTAAQGTSIFFGAPLVRHLGMIGTAGIYFAMNLCAWLIAFRTTLRWPGKTVLVSWRYMLWMVPTLIMVLAVHIGRAGYCLLIFPPLLLVCASIGRTRIWAILAGVLVSLATSYFPYGRFQDSKLWPLNYIFYRSRSCALAICPRLPTSAGPSGYLTSAAPARIYAGASMNGASSQAMNSSRCGKPRLNERNRIPPQKKHQNAKDILESAAAGVVYSRREVRQLVEK